MLRSLGLAALLAAGTAPGALAADLDLPDGFSAQVFAEDLGLARHIAVRDNGDVFVIRRRGEEGKGIVALRDTDGDGVADEQAEFGPFLGTGVDIRDDMLYASSNTAVYRFALPGDGGLAPTGAPELVVGGFPEQRSHAAKTFTFDRAGNIYVNRGVPSNACQQESRTAGSPGQDPCPQNERSGIWRFSLDRMGQDQMADGYQFARGLRHSVALDWNPYADELYLVQHGRDQLNSLWPDHFDEQDNAEMPAEEMHLVEDGLNAGWPYTFFDPRTNQRLVAPEYGGDGEKVAEKGKYADPIMTFPAHWAPNDMIFYTGDQFPERYQGGAFIAFHGSWNRAPKPQQGYKVVFVPFDGRMPAGEYETFADGFAGEGEIASPRDAEHRPMGLAVGPDGALYITDSVKGTVWRVTHDGAAE